jgi:hypothetical protein
MPDGRLGYRAGSLKPMWVDVPLLYVLSQFVPGLVPSAKQGQSDEQLGDSAAQAREGIAS